MHPFNTNSDIGGSSPFMYSRGALRESRRQTNPLVPDYQMPGYTPHPLPQSASAPRDILWTLPQTKWKPSQRADRNWSDEEKYGRGFLFRTTVPTRQSLVSHDITGPQLRTEAPRTRVTDPLNPVYLYDGGPIPQPPIRVPHHGSMLSRTAEENYNLRTDDILTEKIFNREYPKALIKTRPSNRIDDITGAQADTRCAAPKLWKIKDPSMVSEKLTNRVMDIEGAIAGTGGQGPLLYRTRKQAAAVSAASSATMRAMTAPKLSMSTMSNAADIAAVRALP